MLECAEYLEAEKGEAAALAFIEDVFETCRMVAEFPLIGASRSHYDRGVRIWPSPPYTIYYSIEDDFVKVRRILHERQDAARIFGVDR